MRLTAITERIEHSSRLDRPGDILRRLVSPLQKLPGARSVLSGTAFGHPLHPFLVTAPIGAWTAASVLDLVHGDRRTTRTLVGAGVLMALPTATSGASDWLDTEGAEQRTGSVHATLNTLATASYAVSWVVRPHHHRAGVATGLLGAGLASAAGWLGGHLVYSQGVGVDTNAFSHGPTDWSPLGVAPEPGVATGATVEGTRLVATQLLDGPAVLGDRCSHRGGPLSEGPFEEGWLHLPVARQPV